MNKLDIVAPVKSTDGRLHSSTPHDSAIKQVAGRAEYVDDLTEPDGISHHQGAPVLWKRDRQLVAL